MKFNLMFILSLMGMILGNIKKVSLIKFKPAIYNSYDILFSISISIIVFALFVITIKNSKSWLEQILGFILSSVYLFINIKDLLYGINIYLYYDAILCFVDLVFVSFSIFLVAMSILRLRHAPKEKKIKYDKKYKNHITKSLLVDEFNIETLSEEYISQEIFGEDEFIFEEIY